MRGRRSAGTGRPHRRGIPVAGEAGIGKSRLVAEVVDRVEASAGRVLGAACLPYHTDVSLWPISQLLEQVVGSRG